MAIDDVKRICVVGETRDPADMPSPTLARMYATNEWGRKTGRGFYAYSE